MRPRKDGLFAVAKESEKQDRSDNVTGNRRHDKRKARNDKRSDEQGSHGDKKGHPSARARF